MSRQTFGGVQGNIMQKGSCRTNDVTWEGQGLAGVLAEIDNLGLV